MVVDSVDKPSSITGSPEKGRSTPDESLACAIAKIATAYRLNVIEYRLCRRRHNLYYADSNAAITAARDGSEPMVGIVEIAHALSACSRVPRLEFNRG